MEATGLEPSAWGILKNYLNTIEMDFNGHLGLKMGETPFLSLGDRTDQRDSNYISSNFWIISCAAIELPKLIIASIISDKCN